MENSFYGSLEKYSDDDFVGLLENKHGWSVAEQGRDILNGAKYGDQNHNALKYIADFAKSKGETELAESITEYLKETE